MTTTAPPKHLDYSLVGKETAKAIENGLAEADWYQCPVPREQMRELLQRKDGPAIRDTILWFALLFITAGLTVALWPSPWAIVPWLAYAVLYASTSDSRWHESNHGTAFKTDWMNNALYEIASFMVMRESTVWRWSHVRHHSDTIIVGRDPEIAVPRPPDVSKMILGLFNLTVYPKYFKSIVMHCFGKLSEEEKTFIPEIEYGRVIFKSRIYVLIYAGVIAACFVTGSILPLLLIGLPNLVGSWLMSVYGFTQHAGLAENVLDHRLNCRTVYMNPLNRYLYWNMNYHVEHHMFPLVPYHNLPKLHALVKHDCPTPYDGLVEAYKEIIPAILRQRKEPAWCVKRVLPEPVGKDALQAGTRKIVSDAKPVDGKWVAVCSPDMIKTQDPLRFDHGNKTFAIYRGMNDRFYATEGFCTHGNTHLADGLVIENLIECPKHNGRFDYRDGTPARAPVCVALKTYDVRVADGKVWLDVVNAKGKGAIPEKTYTFRVVSNDNVATFIKELVLEPVDALNGFQFTPGSYMQLNIPVYERIDFDQFNIKEPYNAVWKVQHVYDNASSNAAATRRNYSLANNPLIDKQFRFNVRIATPPRGQDCAAGVGSTYAFNLKPGDTVTAIGPFGDFHIKPTQREMIYLGGGAGMAPMRAHLSHLFEVMKTSRRVSFWYGARSRQELFYQDYFESLAAAHPNFTFHVALSEPLPTDNWEGPTGFIHEVLLREYLGQHHDPHAIEYYLCGPPAMIQAATKMLAELGVDPSQIAFDEF
jgi:Na(+)-translocating NADH:ubiquinone oxidoreductase F subunit